MKRFRKKSLKQRKHQNKKVNKNKKEDKVKTIQRKHRKICPFAAECSKYKGTNYKIIYTHFWENLERKTSNLFLIVLIL